MHKGRIPQAGLVMAPFYQLIRFHPALNTMYEAPTVAAEMFVDLLLKDLHRPVQQLHHGLHHTDQGHLIVATAVLVAFLQTPIAVKTSLIVVRLID